MDTSTNKVRIGSMVHALLESGVETSCGLRGAVVTLAPWIYGENVDSLVDCMTCLVGRSRNKIEFKQVTVPVFKVPYPKLPWTP